MRLLICDLKRVFASKGTVALCMLAPVVVMLIFASVIAPMFFAAKMAKFNVAICDNDKSEPVKTFVDQLVNSQALRDIIDVYPADSEEHGLSMLGSGDVYVFVLIPQNLFEDMRAGREIAVDIYGTKAHQLEISLISMALTNSLSILGRSENLLESAGAFAVSKGATMEEGRRFVEESTDYAIGEYMNRRLVLGQGGTISPVGEYLPAEYYLAAIFALFAALTMIPLVRFTAADLSGAIISRGLLSGRGAAMFYCARLASGFVFTLLVLLMVFPTGALLVALNTVIHTVFASNFSALAAAAALSALCYSAFAAALAAWIPNEEAALWTAFYLVLVMAMVSGALLPEGTLPAWTKAIGRLMPMRASMRAMAGALFSFHSDLFRQDMARLGGWTAALAAAGLAGFGRKGRGR